MSEILVVDDSPTMRRMVIASLRNIKDVNFHEASNGLEAIEQLALLQVKLVILDLNMPDMHGLEVVSFMRSHKQYQATPIIILTTRNDNESRDIALAKGASAYMTKPFLPNVLAAQVVELLNQNT